MKDFRQMKQRGEKITALTAYDYPTARLLDESGIDIILVGDSLGMVVLGYQDTTRVTLEEMLHHTRAVARGVKQALLVADMPIDTYDTPEQAVATARKFVDAGAQAVKLEGGVESRRADRSDHASRHSVSWRTSACCLKVCARKVAIKSRAGRNRRPKLCLLMRARWKKPAHFLWSGDCARRCCEADHKCNRHPNYWHRFGRALRRTNSGHARFDRPVSLVYAEVCFAGGARGGGNSPWQTQTRAFIETLTPRPAGTISVVINCSRHLASARCSVKPGMLSRFNGF